MADNHIDFAYEYLRTAYRSQIERTDKIRERVSFVSGFLLLLGTGLGSLITKYSISACEHPVRDVVFLTTWIAAGALLLVAVGQTAYCHLNSYKYANTRSAIEVLDHIKEWEAYNNNPDVADKRDISTELKRQLCEVYATSATFNQKLNTKRNDVLYKAQRVAFAAAVIAALPTVCLVLAKYDNPNRPTDVRIVEPIRLNIK